MFKVFQHGRKNPSRDCGVKLELANVAAKVPNPLTPLLILALDS